MLKVKHMPSDLLSGIKRLTLSHLETDIFTYISRSGKVDCDFRLGSSLASPLRGSH